MATPSSVSVEGRPCGVVMLHEHLEKGGPHWPVHSGPVRGNVPGTARIRETTALGEHGANRRYWPEPQLDRGKTSAPGRAVRKASVVPHPPG